VWGNVSSSVLPGLTDSSSDGRLVVDDKESPRRRLDNEIKKSEEAEYVRECEVLVGVAGGVMAPLCILVQSGDIRANEYMHVGESGGVDMARRFEGLECVCPGMASLYPSFRSVLMLSWICVSSSLAARAESKIPESSAGGNTKPGTIAMLSFK
jgi:hypothetical protein